MFEPVAGPVGAFVRGVDLSAPLDPEVAATLADGLLTHGVLVFRGSQLQPAELLQLGRALGELETALTSEHHLPDRPEVVELTNVLPNGDLIASDSPVAAALQRHQRWQTDGSFRSTPTLFTLSQAVEVPSRGGQTQFADMRRALKLLPPQVRTEMNDLWLVHNHGDEQAQHRWIRTNPDGQQSLYMGLHASHIADRDRDESHRWFQEIEAQLPVHDVFYEHQWQVNDIVIWDNRVTLHRDLGYDMANEPRSIRVLRVTERR